jgi:hypothetical protein
MAHNDGSEPLRHPSFNDADLRELLSEGLSVAELAVVREGRTFDVWVWGSRSTITMEQLNAVAPLVDDLINLDEKCRAALFKGIAGSQPSVVTYGEHHCDVDVIAVETLNAVLGDLPHTPQSVLSKVCFLKASIFADPGSEFSLPDGQVAVFDYGLGYEISQYVLAVGVDHKGNILEITMES